MTGRTRLAFTSCLATMLVACSLLPLVSPAGWYFEAMVLVAAQAGAGAAARRVPLSRPLTVLAQLVTVLLTLTFVFSHGSALAGIVPTPSSVAHLSDLVSSGVRDVGQYQTPAPVTDGIRLLLVGGVVLVAVVVDVLAVTFRNAAPAGLPLLALYSVAAGLSTGSSHGLWFVLGAAGYLLLLLAEGRDRLSRWGRVFAPGPARGGPAGPAGPADGAVSAPVRTGRRIGAMALGIALIAPLALPSLGDGILGTDRPGGSGFGGVTINAINPIVTMQDNLNQPDNREVLRYRTTSDDNTDMYLRTVALDDFDGASWKSSDRALQNVPHSDLPNPQGLDRHVARQEIRTTVSTAGWFQRSWLPMPYPATRVRVGGQWRFEPVNRTVVGDRKQSTSRVSYEVTSIRVEPTAAQLENAPEPPPQILREYTRVPPSLPIQVNLTADRVTRGAHTAYEKALKLQDWFAASGGFTYDTHVNSGTGTSAILRFLQAKRGFCIHFAFSMAAMARTLGIPARVAVGYVPGTAQADGTYSVGTKDEHAWPELYFQGVGWIRFEPTPSRGSTPDYARPETPTGGVTDPGLQPHESTAPTVAPTESTKCGAQEQREGICGAQNPAGAGGGGGGGLPTGSQVALGFGILLAVLLPLVPMFWRARLRRRRLGAGRGGPGVAWGRSGPGAGVPPGVPPTAAAARTLAMWQELLDTAWDLGFAPEESETPRRAVARIVRDGSLPADAAGAARRVASAVEQVLYAPVPSPVAGLADDVRAVRSALLTDATRWVRLRALLLPRSGIRVLWSLTSSWTSTTTRAAAALRRLTPSGAGTPGS
jgi:transglutaminase-like putative cysteine protease